VRLCGLARAAQGQEAARQGKITEAERSAGTLRATFLEGDASRKVAARFSDVGLDGWECSCPVGATHQAALAESSAAHPQEVLHPFACEHVAALLAAWLRDARQFYPEGGEHAPALPAAQAVPQHPALPATSRQAQAAAPGTLPAAPAALESLGPPARHLLGLLALAGGNAADEEARRLFARMGLGPIEAAPQILSQLQEAGWLQPVELGNRGRSRLLAVSEARGWMIPAELLAQVPREVVLEEAADPDAGAGLSAHLAEGQRLPGQMVLALAQALVQPAPADLPQKVQGQLSLPGEQARFLLVLLYQAGLLSGEQAHLTARVPGPVPQEQAEVNFGAAAGETLLRGARFLLWRAAEEVARDLLALWLHARPARELADLRDAGVRVATLHKRERRAGSDIAGENQAAKAFVLALLGAVPAGRWWSFGSWVEFVWRFRPEFLRGRQQGLLRPEWWLERMSDGAVLSPEVRAEWREGEGRYLALLFRRVLHWLGLVDLAFDAQGRLKAFRVTLDGARWLKKTSTADQQLSTAQAALQPETTRQEKKPLPLQAMSDGRLCVSLAALGEAGAAALEMLLCWCEPAGATAEGLLARPTARRAAAALDANCDLEAWLGALESGASAQPAMRALVDRVRGWAAAYGRVRLSAPVALLEVADASLMRELERVVNLAERCDHALGPELAVIRPAEVEALLEELRRRGYLPWMKCDEDAH
jgi:hypothetical protein